MSEANNGHLDFSSLPSLPTGWAWCVPADICSVVASGSTPKPDKMFDGQGDVPFIKVYNLTHRGELNFGVRPTFIGQATHATQLKRSIARPGDVLINIVGPPLGKVSLVPDDFPEWNINQAIVLFRPRDGIFNRYLSYAFLTDSIMKRVTRLAKATAGQSNIGVSMCRHLLPVPLAPLNEQRRIVAKIEELFSDLEAGVAALTRARANLKRSRASVLKAAVEGALTAEWRSQRSARVSDPAESADRRSPEPLETYGQHSGSVRRPATARDEVEPASKLLARILTQRRRQWEADQLTKFAAAGKQPSNNWKAKYAEPSPPDTTNLRVLPDGWCWASVDQVGEVQGGIQKQPKRQPTHNAFPFLRVANVHRNRLDLSEVHQIELFGDELDKLRLRAGDMLIVEGNGSKTEIGRSAIWNGEIEDCVHQNHIIRVRFLAGASRYLNAYWNSPLGNGRVMEMAASTSGLYTLSVTKVCSLPIPLPPLAEQAEIVATVSEKLSQIESAEVAIEHSLRRAARLRQSILKQAFEGKLVPQDLTDEPASSLLERIRSNRSRHEGNDKVASPARSRGRRATSKQVVESSDKKPIQ